MQAVCINLDDRADRWHTFQDAWAPYFDNVARLSAVRHERGTVGCVLSHAAALRKLQSSGADALLVFEDDAQPSADMTRENWARTVAALAANDWWCVYVAGPQLHDIPAERDTLPCVNFGAPAATHFSTRTAPMAQMFVYHKRVLAYLDRFEAAAPSAFADRWFGQHMDVPLLVSATHYATQRPSRSDIEHTFADYTWISDEARDALRKSYKHARAQYLPTHPHQ